MKPEALKELIGDLERHDTIAIGVNLAGAVVNALLVWLIWPSPWAAISLICIGWGVAAAMSQLWYVALRVQQRKFMHDMTADLAQHRDTLQGLYAGVQTAQGMILPEVIERGRATTEVAMQAVIDNVLDGLKRSGDLDPGVQVSIRLDIDGQITTDNTTRH